MLGRAAIPGRRSHLVRNVSDLAANRFWRLLTKVLGHGVADGREVEVLLRQTFGAVRCPADEGRVVNLTSQP